MTLVFVVRESPITRSWATTTDRQWRLGGNEQLQQLGTNVS
jgi:hypothetical protein